MALYARGDKFGVVEANHLLTGGVDRSSSPGDKEIRIFLESGDYVWKMYDQATTSWKYVEKTRSQERVYHGSAILDDNSPLIIPFNVALTATSVKLKLWGKAFPGFPYTELAPHTHPGPVHRHGINLTSGNAGAHDHGGSTGNTNVGTYLMAGHVHSIPNQAAHAHSVSGNSDYGGTGSTGTPSVSSVKSAMDDLIQLYITAVDGTWGTAKTKATTTPVNFSSLANINANGGTDEIDIFALITAGGFNYLRIVEPTAAKGGTILWHLSVS